MMNKSLREDRKESSGNGGYGFRLKARQRQGLPRALDAKKSRRFPAAWEVDNREASNRVDRSHSVSKRGRTSHKRESLTDRKRANLLRGH
jgi:hypothetical protein